MTTRVCSKCNAEKDIEEFPLRNQFTHRRQSYCKDCKSIMGKNWYENNKDYQIANARKHSTEYRNTIREYLWNYLLTHPCEYLAEKPILLFWNSTTQEKRVWQSPKWLPELQALKDWRKS